MTTDEPADAIFDEPKGGTVYGIGYWLTKAAENTVYEVTEDQFPPLLMSTVSDPTTYDIDQLLQDSEPPQDTGWRSRPPML